jgi:hypothetical protein
MKNRLEIENQTDHDQVMRLITNRKKPNAILRMLMNAFEGYRQSKKLGWSRPWNKYDLINFQSFKVKKERDQDLLVLADRIIKQECLNMPAAAVEFADTLIHRCEGLMAFIFVHEFTEDGELYEGATLSLGCKNNKRYRDRLDIIVEAPVIDGNSQGFKRLRVFVDPYTGDKAPLWSKVSYPAAGLPSSDLFARLAEISHDWQVISANHWNHWTSDYIDYFGPRETHLAKSFFYQPVSVGQNLVNIDSQRSQHVSAS